MRRLLVLLILAAALASAAVATGGTATGDGGDYRVAAIFDTGKGMVAGQQVKIAGAVVGRVERVELAPGPKARIVMEIERRFAPFRADASCRILPEGLISENFVECDPGTPGRPELSAPAEQPPTVPLAQTAVPTALQDVINVFSMPVDQRIRVIIDELGMATAGRGEDLDALLRRANPALTQSRRVLAILAGQRRQIANAVAQTDRVLAELSERDDDVRGFVSRSAELAETTAARSDELGETVRRLPALLRSGRGGLRTLDEAMRRTTPLLREVRAGAPDLLRLTATLPAFAREGTPALRALGSAAAIGRRTVRSARPAVDELRAAATQAQPFGRNLEALLTSTRDQGGFEGLLRVGYSLATSFAAYDSVSHIVGLAISVLPQCMASADAPGCNAQYGAPGNGTIPPNDPSCGPQASAPWDPPTDCDPNAAPQPAKTRPRRKPRPRKPGLTRPQLPAAPPAVRPDRPVRPKLPEVSKLPPLRDVLPDPSEPSPLPLDDGILLDFLLGP